MKLFWFESNEKHLIDLKLLLKSPLKYTGIRINSSESKVRWNNKEGSVKTVLVPRNRRKMDREILLGNE